MKLKIKDLTSIIITLFCLSILSWFIIKASLTWHAAGIAEEIIEQAYTNNLSQNDDQKVIALTKYVFENFNSASPSKHLALRLRGYITNKRLPSFIRLDSGVIETILQKGLCDNASRMLSFVLKQEEYRSVQWNMVGNDSGHSALLVTLPGNRNVFVDPFYGYVAKKNDKLIDPHKARQLLLTSKEKTLFPLSKESNYQYYKNFKNLKMAAEGEKLEINVKIPKLSNKEIILGIINNQSLDVQRDAKNLKITPYWHYIGHKYNREWIRTLEATEPVQITMILTKPPDSKILTSNIPPKIKENKLIWNLQPNEKLSFIDGNAKRSFKRMNSFIDIDQIIFEAL